MIEIKDGDDWRIMLVSAEDKHQDKDIDRIKKEKLVGKANNQDLMAA